MAAKKRKLDEIDELILTVLERDARKSSAAIAEEIQVSSSSVRRRIARLERDEIDRFTILRKHEPTDIEAFVEMNFEGEANVPEILKRTVDKRKEVRTAATIAGDPDAVLRLRVPSLDDLGEVVTELRMEMGKEAPGFRVTGSKTLVILKRVRHHDRRLPGEEPEPPDGA